ncbi:NAD-dependent epimerase/dehydratase family protein [Comamonas testosteroni]|jgi:nucleoside-diphosphate-sugar epimerase|uniref:NAD-dependent epimerase/dehydratase n=1 Tax=Comamonas testosteroni (strain DSM 14576 / KF-1) TaxID=399795 RepID=B7X2X3_COMTK|nr:NAD-dependent epimerase/dehydratase family protein [Comamonas testosteroni]EED68526.1 NAD-dependent epimerase/dehydratase [Comamonas testosteroni KF-1]WQG66550.1 NAD-dependent epimerase/dehydratase family protein [Comamonas testosteroni]
MSRVLVTGAAGFVGQALVGRLLDDGIQGRPVHQLVLSDLSLAGVRRDPRLVLEEGSVADRAVQQRLLRHQPEAIFHLASVPGGAAERDPVLGRGVNLEATLNLLETCQELEQAPRFIYASSIAVYGDTGTSSVSEDMTPSPAITYGAHKLACETLLADASRRGWVDGCSLRLPGIVARRDENPGVASAFMSQLFWKIAERKAITLPISPEGRCWWMSVKTCVNNLVHMAAMDSGPWSARRSYQMPVLHLGIDEVVQALAGCLGVDAAALVRYEPHPFTDKNFARYPQLSTPRAIAIGLRNDGSADELVRNVFDHP